MIRINKMTAIASVLMALLLSCVFACLVYEKMIRKGIRRTPNLSTANQPIFCAFSWGQGGRQSHRYPQDHPYSLGYFAHLFNVFFRGSCIILIIQTIFILYS
jgi:hypothetical protein